MSGLSVAEGLAILLTAKAQEIQHLQQQIVTITATKEVSRQIQAKHGLRHVADSNRSLAPRDGVAIGYQVPTCSVPGAG